MGDPIFIFAWVTIFFVAYGLGCPIQCVLLRSAGSAWNFLCTAGGAGRRAAVLTVRVRCSQPKAFVFRQLIFGINANPHYKSFISRRLRLGVAASRPSCGLWYVFCRSSSYRGFFAPIVPAFFLLCLKYAWARGVCLRTPVGFFFGARHSKSCVSCVVKIAAIAARRPARRSGRAHRSPLFVAEL